MSQETAKWLNTNTLIGFTAKRGNAWHYRAELQGAESNHYEMAVPAGDVNRRLFSWTQEDAPLFVRVPSSFADCQGIGDDGMPYREILISGKKAVVRSDTGAVLGIHGDGYARHQFSEWLLNNVSTILGDSVQIGSAGLLKGGAVAWVSVEVPDTITTPEGVAFRPNLLAATSADGSLATTYKRVVTNVVCDNTMAAGLGEAGQQFRVKHTRNSNLRLGDARQALNLLQEVQADFEAEVRELCRIDVTNNQWAAFLNEYAPIASEKGRSRTMAENKQDTLNRLYRRDLRVAPWAGTAYGVMQAVNTFIHHEGIVRGSERAERNMLRAVSGKVDELDTSTVSMLRKVLAQV
jgi:phage/plasmid-like protein (TIGR03299 family)